MIQRKDPRQTLSPLLPLFTRIRPALMVAAFLLIAAIWTTIELRINLEYRTEMDSILRQNANLARAFEESVRKDMHAIDDILRFLETEYESHGTVTAEMLTRMKSTRHIPVVHISIINDRGIIVNSTLPMLLSMNVSDMEYFRAFRQSDYDKPYFAKPVVGRATKKWLFHISRRLSKPDGSMAGAINIGVDPTYFAQFFGQMALGKDYSISIIGKDGFVRVRQTSDATEVGTDVGKDPFFRRVQVAEQGSFIDRTIFDSTPRVFTYRALRDYPLIVTLSVSEAEALSQVNQRKRTYRWGAFLGTTAVVVMFGLLLWMVQKRIDAEEALRRANEALEKTVAERTAELELMVLDLQNALAEVKTLRGIVPICSYCKQIRDDKGYWNQVEKYVSDHTDATFSHGICPACLEKEKKKLDRRKARDQDD
jgi:hypothetical protein